MQEADKAAAGRSPGRVEAVCTLLKVRADALHLQTHMTMSPESR